MAAYRAQVPINVGDANYDPLFPFGWGLSADSKSSRVLAASTGDARRSAALLAPLGAALATAKTAAAQEAIVSVARDLAQAAVTAGKPDADRRLIAGADHALLTGDARAAFTLLTKVAD